MPGGHKKERRDAWNRFADGGRALLVGSAVALPGRKSALRARFGSGACLLAIKLIDKVLKEAIPEQRPDKEDDKSFPSEHAAECVASAMLIAREYPRAVGALACGLAAAVSFSRIESKKHYPHDVAAGALIGLLAVWGSLQVRRAAERRLLF